MSEDGGALNPWNDPDLIPASTAGYWVHKTPCKGFPECRGPIHRFTFNEGPVHHTRSYVDTGRDKQGRFVSPYSTWRKFKRMAERLKERAK